MIFTKHATFDMRFLNKVLSDILRLILLEDIASTGEVLVILRWDKAIMKLSLVFSCFPARGQVEVV